jgi:hypothetical protein
MTPFLIGLICLGVLAYVLLPLRGRAVEYSIAQTADVTGHEILLEKRNSLLRQIKELEFDRSMEKINADDYARMRSELSAEAAVVIERIESGQSASATTSVPDSAAQPANDLMSKPKFLSRVRGAKEPLRPARPRLLGRAVAVVQCHSMTSSAPVAVPCVLLPQPLFRPIASTQ